MVLAKGIARVITPLIFILLVVCAFIYKKKIEPVISDKNRKIINLVVLLIFIIVSIWTVATVFFR